MAVLWSEFLALWFDRTRRRAVPLLLATLLLLIPSLPARCDCSCELAGEGTSLAHHHEESEAHEHHHEQGEAHEHLAARNPVSARGGHAFVVASGQVVGAQSEAVCCSCSRAPLSAATAVVSAPSQANFDGQNLVYVSVNAPSVHRVDSLTGLFGRAGPPPDSKPRLLYLASLAGRAPPVSL